MILRSESAVVGEFAASNPALADDVARVFTADGSPVSMEKAAQVYFKYEKAHGPEEARGVVLLLKKVAEYRLSTGGAVPGLGGLAGWMSGKTEVHFARGHAWNLETFAPVLEFETVQVNGAVRAVRMETVKLNHRATVQFEWKGVQKTGDVLPDQYMVIQRPEGSTVVLLREAKFAVDSSVVRASEFNMQQLEKYRALARALRADGETVHVQFLIKGRIDPTFASAIQRESDVLIELVHTL